MPEYVIIESHGDADHRLHNFRALGKNGIEYSYGIYCTNDQVPNIKARFLSGLNIDLLNEVYND